MQVRYNRKEDILVLELSPDPVDHAEEAGLLIAHFSTGTSTTRVWKRKETSQGDLYGNLDTAHDHEASEEPVAPGAA